jgi:DNA/RNA endonuclease YhcR with UshA esterase domain
MRLHNWPFLYATIASILLVHSAVLGQTIESKIYTATEAAKHIGETATVTDRVDGVHQSGKGNIFLNMGGKYPNQAFTAFIPSGSAGQFPGYQKYDGQTVAVSGKITLYHGKPEIAVSSPTQLRPQ